MLLPRGRFKADSVTSKVLMNLVHVCQNIYALGKKEQQFSVGTAGERVGTAGRAFQMLELFIFFFFV